jgi:oligosaccharyl transferase complex subunit OST4
MITDDQLYQLAIFLGSVSMLLIVLYHFLEVNAENDDKTPLSAERKADTVPGAKPVRS